MPSVWLQHHERVRFYEDLARDNGVAINYLRVLPEHDRQPAYSAENVGRAHGQDLFLYSVTLQPESATRKT
ncbi:hypothetical protein [Pseudomonas paeninsulae]|uniref:hypothetical protein n=1 Tax=Pseudomonas paeninsulae TaxID=3110772 RepID=UPI002D784F52|nr:hypothetical protein [Pseudomonas sp. IT1137]